MTFESYSLSISPWLWLALAVIGHTVLWVYVINVTSGVVTNKKHLSLLRKVYFSMLFAGPVLFAAAYRIDRYLPWPTPQADLLRDLLAGYGLVCVVLAVTALPLSTAARWLRRDPVALASNHTQMLDVAGRLGYRPYGHGKYRLLSRLPFNQIFQVDFTEKTLRFPHLPREWDGLTILHLSDLHFIGIPDKVFFQAVMDQCRDWEADLVALTGDLVDTDHHHRWIVPVLGRLKWRIGAFAILGNHDYWREPALIRRRLRKVGFDVVGNGWRQVEVRGCPLLVIGNESPWFQPAPDLAGCPASLFRLCLSHTPDHVYWGRQHGIDLMLAGHNHGGQVRFPLLGSVFAPSRFSRRFDSGLFAVPPTLLHVSRGLAGQHPLRYNCRPEITRLVLARG